MSEFLINKSRTCAFTGHRILYKDFQKRIVEEIIEKLIKIGYDTFLVGMALGFDSECFRILEKKREKENIRIIACIPCPSQAERFSLEQKREYERMVACADEKIVLSKEYTKRCMQKRNEFLVDNSSVVVAYLRREKSGTASTVNYAIKNGVQVINV